MILSSGRKSKKGITTIKETDEMLTSRAGRRFYFTVYLSSDVADENVSSMRGYEGKFQGSSFGRTA